MRGLGKGIREFNDAKNNVRRELEDGLNEPPRQQSTTVNNQPQSTTTTTSTPQ
jgi:sec-independent protein translocase protein TatA